MADPKFSSVDESVVAAAAARRHQCSCLIECSVRLSVASMAINKLATDGFCFWLLLLCMASDYTTKYYFHQCCISVHVFVCTISQFVSWNLEAQEQNVFVGISFGKKQYVWWTTYPQAVNMTCGSLFYLISASSL